MKKMSNVSKQMNLFYLAVSFFTRFPVPKSVIYSPEHLNKASRYFSLVGLLLGLLLAALYLLLIQGFSPVVSVLLLMMISVLFTGAFHEDGLADMADGIGGAFEKDKRLTIMKDSRIGTYGAVTLFFALALKFVLLTELANKDSSIFVLAIVLASSMSRALAASYIFDMPYVSDEKNSKSKPLAQSQTKSELAILLIFGCLPLLLFPVLITLSCLLVLFVFRFSFKAFLVSRIGGFTGDCLGAAQQISELVIYLLLVFILDDVVYFQSLVNVLTVKGVWL
jgi:adenosylcobinamide-GDP ribazoletransferase